MHEYSFLSDDEMIVLSERVVVHTKTLKAGTKSFENSSSCRETKRSSQSLKISFHSVLSECNNHVQNDYFL